jgi:hypothetical protein
MKFTIYVLQNSKWLPGWIHIIDTHLFYVQPIFIWIMIILIIRASETLRTSLQSIQLVDPNWIHTTPNSTELMTHNILASCLSICLHLPKRKLTTQELCVMVRVNLLVKGNFTLLNRVGRIWQNLLKTRNTKFTIYDWWKSKHIVANGFISSTHIFLMYTLLHFEALLLLITMRIGEEF